MRRIGSFLSVLVSAVTSLFASACARTEPPTNIPAPQVDESQSNDIKQNAAPDEKPVPKVNEDAPVECVYGPPEAFGLKPDDTDVPSENDLKPEESDANNTGTENSDDKVKMNDDSQTMRELEKVNQRDIKQVLPTYGMPVERSL